MEPGPQAFDFGVDPRLECIFPLRDDEFLAGVLAVEAAMRRPPPLSIDTGHSRFSAATIARRLNFWGACCCSRNCRDMIGV